MSLLVGFCWDELDSFSHSPVCVSLIWGPVAYPTTSWADEKLLFSVCSAFYLLGWSGTF